MRVAIVGSAGQLGAAVVREFDDRGDHVLPLTHEDADVTDRSVVAMLVRLHPDAIINCTAWNDVERAEEDPSAAYAVNHIAVEYLAAAARELGATLVHYSTDFVFDGRDDRPYDESAPAAPVNHYGKSKLAG